MRVQVETEPAERRDDLVYVPYRLDQRLEPAVVACLVSKYEGGTPTTELTAAFGLSKASVLKLLGDAGVSLRRQGLSELQTEQAAELYRSGLSLARVGERLGLGPTSVASALKAARVTLRGRHERRDPS